MKYLPSFGEKIANIRVDGGITTADVLLGPVVDMTISDVFGGNGPRFNDVLEKTMQRFEGIGETLLPPDTSPGINVAG